MEHTAGGALQRARNISGNRGQRRSEIIEIRQGIQEALGVGMRRRLYDLTNTSGLDNLGLLHHRHPVGGLCDDTQIVGDEQNRHAEF